MTTLLHIDSSARPGDSATTAHGSHTRRLSKRFVDAWRAARPDTRVIRRDVGAAPPRAITGEWIRAAFTPVPRRTAELQALLSSRGDGGYGLGEAHAHMNHVESSIRSAFAYIGIDSVDMVAIEYDEFGDERLQRSITRAEAQVDGLVARLSSDLRARPNTPQRSTATPLI